MLKRWCRKSSRYFFVNSTATYIRPRFPQPLSSSSPSLLLNQAGANGSLPRLFRPSRSRASPLLIPYVLVLHLYTHDTRALPRKSHSTPRFFPSARWKRWRRRRRRFLILAFPFAAVSRVRAPRNSTREILRWNPSPWMNETSDRQLPSLNLPPRPSYVSSYVSIATVKNTCT